MHTLSRNDSVSGATGSAGLASSPDGQTMLPGLAGMHRGSINGIPGGGFPGATGRSPVKESSFLARSASIDEANMGKDEQADNNLVEGSVSPPAKREGIPIRR